MRSTSLSSPRLAESGEAAPRLARLSSTTFDSQLDVATRVAQESPELYFEIQSLNDYGAESLEALAKAVERIRAAVLSRDHDAFVALMRQGREYLEDRRSVARAAGLSRAQRKDRAIWQQRTVSRRAARGARTSGCGARLEELTEEVGRNDDAVPQDPGAGARAAAGQLADAAARAADPGLRESYQLDAVTLVLHDPQHEIRHLLAGDGFLVEELEGVHFVDALTTAAPQVANLERPWLGPFRLADHELLLPASRSGGSLALIPLTPPGAARRRAGLLQRRPAALHRQIWPAISWRIWGSCRPSASRTRSTARGWCAAA